MTTDRDAMELTATEMHLKSLRERVDRDFDVIFAHLDVALIHGEDPIDTAKQRLFEIVEDVVRSANGLETLRA